MDPNDNLPPHLQRQKPAARPLISELPMERPPEPPPDPSATDRNERPADPFLRRG